MPCGIALIAFPVERNQSRLLKQYGIWLVNVSAPASLLGLKKDIQYRKQKSAGGILFNYWVHLIDKEIKKQRKEERKHVLNDKIEFDLLMFTEVLL